MNGIVKFYREDRNFGYIKVENSDDIFFHKSNCEPGIAKNDEVEFETKTNERGLYAFDIKKVVKND
jgi:cold shock CspA family protein